MAKNNYKDTLLMFKTSFSMRANLVNTEANFQDFWKKNDYYKKILKRNYKNKNKIIIDGPPYANGTLHLGHALNKILKDFFTRYYLLNGYYSEVIMGWDTHGLPIENKVIKKNKNMLGASFKEITTKCKKYSLSQVDLQNKQFKRMGLVFHDYKKYLTMDKKYEAAQVGAFFKMYNKKIIYKDKKPILWSWSSSTALAESEVLYENIDVNSIYLKFKIINKKYKGLNLLVWTTTPWTIPGNFAICINLKIKYNLIIINNEKIIIANNLINDLENKTKKSAKIIKKIDNNELLNSSYINILNSRIGKIIEDDSIESTKGTGIVHMSPFHGEEDFYICKKNNIFGEPIVNKKGEMINAGEFNDVFFENANKIIIEKLKSLSSLFLVFRYKHQYPYDWRTKKSLFYLSTEQWFINIKKYSQQILRHNEKINFFPEWGKKTLNKMIISRNSWCISRQRKWGVPIPIIYNEHQKVINNKEINKKIIDLIAKNGVSFWWDKSLSEILENTIPSSIDISSWKKEIDIMDVWFDSGLVTIANKDLYNKKVQNNEFILIEGNDQFRGWFNCSSIINSIVDNSSLAHDIVIHGFILDKNKIKMSKSIGNIITPEKIINNYGADILRFWIAHSDYNSNIFIDNVIINNTVDNYKKIRNTIRFMTANIINFDFENKYKWINQEVIDLRKENFNIYDLYILRKLRILLHKIEKNYKKYNTNKTINEIIIFCVSILSNGYLDWSKDILYVNSKNCMIRKNIQKTFWIILITLIKILSPILPHTCENWFDSFKKDNLINDNNSIHDMPFIKDIKINIKNNDKILEEFELFSHELKQIWKKITNNENSPFILKSYLETHLYIKFNNNISITNSHINLFYSFAGIGKISENNKNDALVYSSFNDKTWNSQKLKIIKNIIIKKHSGLKCPRCWKYAYIANMKKYNNENICQRCYDVIDELN